MRKVLIILIAILPIILSAAYLENLLTQVTQPDGTILDLLASGDEFANRLHDSNGYTIIQSRTDGFYYYAEKDGENLVPSAWKAGSVNPQSRNLTPNLTISETEYKARAEFMHRNDNPSVRTPSLGTVNNLCILIRFADQTEFDTPRFVFEDKFNSVGEIANSQRNYFQKVSYNQLDIITAIYPISSPDVNVSYQDSHPRGYFMPFNAITNTVGYENSDQKVEREQTMLASAVAFAATQIPGTLNLDADNDNYVDNVCFVIRGPHTAWAELLWAHRWYLYYADAFINGKRVGDYTFQPENQNEVFILCHEMFHSIGSPDLYHYDFNGVSPVGCWDIMEAGKGHMGAFMKQVYGSWLPSSTLITATGDYTLNPITSPTGNYYRINVPGVTGESIRLEYRKQGSDFFESNLPDSGLLIYRINSALTGNADGPPDEVYIYRPDGSVTVNGQIANAAFSADNYRTEFNDFTNPNCLLVNNNLGHVNISNIGFCGDTITFHYTADTTNLPPQVQILYPADDVVLTTGTHYFNATASVTSGSISQIELKLDGNVLQTYTAGPFVYNWTAGTAELGYHELVVTAYSAAGLQSAKRVRFRVIDPMLENWFNWTTDTPVYSSFGRGSIPIQAAIDLDLGTEDFVVKQLAFHIEDDPFGDPLVPGLISAKINRFANGLITEQTLLNLGDFTSPMTGHFEAAVNDTTVINGKIALILNLYEYQNIVFDTNGVTGHSWLTEPDRPWTDAQGRGMLGAADMGLKLQSPNVGIEENVTYPSVTRLSVYPNPFKSVINIEYSTKNLSKNELAIYNIKGQLIKTLVNENLPKGKHSFAWDGKDEAQNSVASGVYLCRLASGSTVKIQRMLLLK